MPIRTVRETVPSDARLEPFKSGTTRTRLSVSAGPVARRAAVERVPSAHVGACASYAFNHSTSPPTHSRPYKPSQAGSSLLRLGPATLFTPGMIGSRLAFASAQLATLESVREGTEWA